MTRPDSPRQFGMSTRIPSHAASFCSCSSMCQWLPHHLYLKKSITHSHPRAGGIQFSVQETLRAWPLKPFLKVFNYGRKQVIPCTDDSRSLL